jgi:hypothetical protein
MARGLRKLALALAFLACGFVGIGTTPPRSTTVYIVNRSPVSNVEIQAAMPAWQAAVSEDFRRYWHVDAELRFVVKAPENGWRITLLQYPTATGCGFCAGIHGATDKIPWAQVGTFDNDWSMTLTHELFEMLADPYISSDGSTAHTLTDAQHRRWIVEPADPVAMGGYDRAGGAGTTARISDFVTPAWYLGGPGPYDFLDALKAPHELGFGGYAYYYDGDGLHPWQDTGGFG